MILYAQDVKIGARTNPAEDATLNEEYGSDFTSITDENGEEILVTIDDDDELEAVYGALMDLIYEDEDTEEADEN